MIYLFTGAPGSSKTLNVIKTISEDSTFKGRDVYYHRIKELKLPWISLDENEVKEWDTLTVPKTFPRPQCIRFNRGYDNPPVCKCYSQQATPLNVSEKACNRYVDNGYFDHTRPDFNSDSMGGVPAQERDQGLPRALAGTANVSVTR